MKKILIYLFVLAGCTSTTGLSMDGIYTCSYKNEFYTIKDTLILKSINKNVYQIERRTTANKNFKSENWMLTYDEEKKVLTELKKGKTLVISNGNLIFGNRIYKKITP
ncbi:MAG: hypothetical protein H0W12_12300 [Chitinophagaceae bacterium]|nr:hypothetical protein [Chitinophagaceae bacterium]